MIKQKFYLCMLQHDIITHGIRIKIILKCESLEVRLFRRARRRADVGGKSASTQIIKCVYMCGRGAGMNWEENGLHKEGVHHLIGWHGLKL